MLNLMGKKKKLREVGNYREELFKHPQLRQLFLELTLRCNEKCLHCGSSCGDVKSEEMPVEVYDRFLREIKEDFGIENKMLCITGGEPLLRKEFFDIMSIANELDFNWGMTSNATLINDSVASDLYKVGMKTISVSIDGLESTHDAFRRTPGGYKKAMEGIESLIKFGKFKHVQVTTVVTHENIGELDELYKIFNEMDIDSWRIFEMDPIGRAKQYPNLALTPEDCVKMFEFIRNKRMQGEPVTYGCSHYLGMEYEREVRDWYFFCGAGTQIASIMANGDIAACLDIERRPEFIQGNIMRDRFKDVWENKFKEFRRNLCECNEKCRNCEDAKYCHGGAFHTWDFDKNEQQMCFKDIIF